MVVCKCRKATKLYCFVHKVPVCGECICFSEHEICVVRTYSEWVIDGEYDWPPVCCQCKSVLEEGVDHQTTRLGCLHVIHTSCLISHIQSFPPHTAPAGYVCPACSTSIWPPKNVKDFGSRLHSKLKEAIMQTGLEKNVFGNHPAAELHGPPPAFASDPLKRVSAGGKEDVQNGKNVADRYSSSSGVGSTSVSTSEIMQVDVPSQEKSLEANHEPNYMKSASPGAPGATTRKGSTNVERQNSEISYYADDEDGNRKKYTRRGPFRHKFLRALLPFWSGALPTLPVTAPPRKDSSHMDDALEGRSRHHRPSRMDPRKILLFIAIMACMATMAILYYRIAQGGLGQQMLDEE